MEYYIKISILLCIYGVFKEFRPAEPYIVPYMTGPPLNLTAEQINHEVFPVSTYASMATLVFVFLLTDYLRYKIIIVIQAVCMIIAFLFLIYGRGVFQMQLEELFYGQHMAGEVAYFTYIYAKVEKDHFQEVTSHARSAYLVGKALCGVVAQAVVYYELCSLQSLLWITVGSQVIAAVWAICLPSVKKSMYFHRSADTDSEKHTADMIGERGASTVAKLLWSDLVAAFTSLYVLKWALWWALATCGYLMATSYCQVLWQVIRNDSHATSVRYNGAVETVCTLLGALGSMAAGRVQVNWRLYGETLLAACSLVMAALLLQMSRTNSETVAYVTFIILTVIFQTMITVSNSEVAKHINRESYGLVFGITTFLVYIARSLFSYIALQFYRLAIRLQFEVYSYYFGSLGVFFVIVAVLKCVKHKCKSSSVNYT